jgi:tRNA A-37 threonylcarbamoyl transferase component Bud32
VVEPGSSQSKGRNTSVRKVRSFFGLAGRPTLSRGFLRRSLWVAPVLALIGLAFAGTWLRSQMEGAMRAQQESQLLTLLKADLAALELWMEGQRDYVDAVTDAPIVHKPILELVELAAGGTTSKAALLQAPQRAQLEAGLKNWLDDPDYAGYVVLDKTGRVLSSNEDSLIGLQPSTGYQDLTKTVFSSGPSVRPPFLSTVILTDEWGNQTAGVPTMFAAAGVKKDGQTVAVLGFRIRPSDDFTKILNVARIGETGETYAFNQSGLLLSSSRFLDQLQEIGLLPYQPQVRSALNVELRDPQVDMTIGARPTLPRPQQPLTVMAADAIETRPTAENPHSNVAGYRDYRGVEVIGAWAWLPQYGFGVATEVDKAEAFRPLYILRAAFWTLFGLLAAVALLLLGVTLMARRIERKMRDAVIAAGKLGQYALEEKIGEGGMGSVYRGRHAMLRRPTAIKLLEPSKTTEVSIERFEREVQHTSQLNHPNTITIYDYGRTDEGVFYYAMEYLQGMSLQSLVEDFGPQPDGRVIHILLQVCGSLVEAHTQGLIHRDIKPANIMLTERGGVRDYVKLLDFGLVKAIDTRKQRSLTAADAITGTPLYLPPEAIQGDVEAADARSDLYSLGGVAYFLLTGQAVFEGGSIMDVIRMQVEGTPVPPSKRLGRPIIPELEQLILKCLAKDPGDRPQSAAEIAKVLSQCVPRMPWTTADAELWWQQYDRRTMAATATQPFSVASTLGSVANPAGKPAL